MNTLSKIKDFFSRHRSKIVVTGIVVGSAVFITRFTQRKFKEWQEVQRKDFMEKAKKRQHFENTERTCNHTVLSLKSVLDESINKVYDIDSILEAIKSNPDSKVELWNKLKITVFAKTAATIYCYVLLVVSFRIQLCVLGGYIYKDAVTMTTELQESYLSIFQSFIDSGIQKVCVFMNGKVASIIDSLDLRRALTLHEVEELFWSIQTTVCGSEQNPIQNMEFYVGVDTKNLDGILKEMTQETLDLFGAEDVHAVVSTCVTHCFSLLMDKLAEFYIVPSSSSAERIANPEVALAKTIPILNRLVSQRSFTEELVHILLQSAKLRLLSANIYESFTS